MTRLITIICILLSLSMEGVCQTISFENGVPAQFNGSKKSKLSVTGNYYKDGQKSLKWNFIPGSTIDVALQKPVELDSKTKANSGIYLWIYNEQPATDSLSVEFLTPQNNVAYRFSFRLFSKGWRACWIGFKHMHQLQDASSIASYRFVAPQRKGQVYIDRLTFPVAKVNDRTTPDYQMPNNNSLSYRDLWHWCRVWQWEQYDYDIELPAKLTASQKDELALVEQRMDEYFKLGKDYRKKISNAYKKYEEAGIRKSGKGFTGKPVVAPDERNKKDGEMIWEDLETMLAGFAYDALVNHSDIAMKNYFIVWDYAIDQGFAWGSGMGTNHHYGYQVRNIYTTAWLMREHIVKASASKEILAALSFWSALQETRKPCQQGRDELLDSWHTLLEPKMVSAMMETDECKRYRAMQGLTRWLSTSLNCTPGTIGGIKVDGTTFHHGGFYPAYTTGVLAGIGLYTHLTDATAFEPTTSAKQTLKSAFIAMRNYSNLHEWGIGLGGRHPFNWGMKQDDIESFAYLALAGDLTNGTDGIDRSLAADYLRLCTKNTPNKKYFQSLGIEPAKAPQGMFVYNYGAAGIYRRNDWMVTLKGFNTDVWCSEIYKKDNRYGRYQSYGSVQIFGEPSRLESGYNENGWDWNRLPGTTTIHLPWELLDSPNKNTMMAHSSENFAGASSLKGEYGVFAIKLKERNYHNFTPDFVARKSVFCFGNRLICLGTGISNSNSEYPTETTLFQSVYSPQHLPKVSGRSILKTGYNATLMAKPGNIVKIEDGYRNVYYLKQGIVNIQTANQESRHEKTRALTHGAFASAWINHGVSPQNQGYEYLICIQPDSKEEQNAVSSYEVLRKDDHAHIVKDLQNGVTAYVVFDEIELQNDDMVGSVSAETMLMRQPSEQGVTMSVCDPNLNISEKAYTTKEPSRPIEKLITLNGKWKDVSGNEKLSISYTGNATILKVICQHGVPVEFSLERL